MSKNKEQIFKFRVPLPKYPYLLNESLSGIKLLIGEFDVIKTKNIWSDPTEMFIYIKPKNTNQFENIIDSVNIPKILHGLEKLADNFTEE